MKKNSILFTLLLAGGIVSAQQNFWKPQSKSVISSDKIIERVHQPTESITMNLNFEDLTNYLTQGNKSQFTLKFPDATGNLNSYRIVENSNFHPDLQAKYSNIRSYTGYNLNNPAEKIAFSISPQFGFNGVIDQNGKQIIIDTHTKDKASYLIYNKSNVFTSSDNFICDVESEAKVSGLGIDNLNIEEVINSSTEGRTLVTDNKLHTFRMAVTTTTEYSTWIAQQAGIPNGTIDEKKAAILAAVNVSLTRINGVLKNDAGVFLQLIPNNDLLFFIDSDTFDSTDASQMLNENINVTNNIIGVNNYDLGHLFFRVSRSSNNNGLAQLQSVCTTNKAGGVTGTTSPVGDPFDIDYTAHEIGHQFGAHHTQNNACNRANASAEPGSGSTIMAYTGICAPNIQRNSDAYYHAFSLDQINNVLSAKTCGTKTEFNNLPPVITIEKALYNIPHSTAFELTMTATDPNNDQMTYTWEQMDTAVGEVMPPISSNTRGPMFRSFTPSESPSRYFPKMEKILADQIVFETNPYISSATNYHLNNWEVIPNNARTLNFAAVARDNNPNVGLTSKRSLAVRLRDAGPFKVTSQTTADTWIAGQTQTVTWDVAGTDANSIDTSAVKILLSLDGGQTWEHTLVASTPNNGSYTFTVPAGLGNSTSARLMIRPVDNIYLAVNKVNFTIESPLAVGDIEKLEAVTISPNPTKGEVNIQLNKNFNNVVVYVNDMTGKQVSNYNSTNQSAKSHRLNLSHLPNGVYVVSVKADGEQFTKKLIIKK